MSEKISHTTENLFNQVRLQIAHFLEKIFFFLLKHAVSPPQHKTAEGAGFSPGTIRPVWGSKALLGR